MDQDAETPSEAATRNVHRQILEELSSTQFACTELTLLPAGTTNFVFRGTLKRPFTFPTDTNESPEKECPRETIIVKHLENFARVNPALQLDSSHGPFEIFMIREMERFLWNGKRDGPVILSPPFKGAERDVRVPRVPYINESKNTLAIEDLGVDSTDMRGFLSRTDIASGVDLGQEGKTIGKWLRAFHEWTTEDNHDQQRLRDAMRAYEEMGKFRRGITYQGLPKWCEEVGLLDANTKVVFLRLQELVVEEFSGSQSREVTEEWGPIHGDFWTGNILVPSFGGHFKHPSFAVVDWEFAHLGPRAYDLGHMIGDLIELTQLRQLESFRCAIESFVEGYGAISKKMAFRVLVHAGAHLIGWYVRGPKKGVDKEEIWRIVKLGRDMICFGMNKNEQWFRDNKLGVIFDQIASE